MVEVTGMGGYGTGHKEFRGCFFIYNLYIEIE